MKRINKIIAGVVTGLMVMTLVTGCGSDGADSGSEKKAVKEYVAEEDLDELYTTPDKFSGMYVKLSGQIFLEPEKEGDYIYFQMWLDPDKAEGNTIVRAKADQRLKSDDYVAIEGKVVGEFSGDNMFGGTITAPSIEADVVEVIDYISAVSPTITEKAIDETQDQYGYAVTVEKIEFAENETRIYVSLVNNGTDTFCCYGFNAKVIQEGRQISSEDNYMADYPSIESDLLKGASTEGIITFPALNAEVEFDLYIDGYSNNWEEDIEPYVFSIK